MRLNDLVDAVHERGHTHGDLLRLGELEGPPEGGRDDLVQAIPDVLFLPEIFLHILDPFEIRDDHAAGIRQDVRDDKDADRKSTRLNSSHGYISYAVFCLKKKNTN